MEFRVSNQGRGDVLIQDDLDTVLGELVLVCNIEHLIKGGHISARVQGVDNRKIDAREWSRSIDAIGKDKDTSSEGVQSWGEGTGIMELGGLVKSHAVRGRIKKLEFVDFEARLIDEALNDSGHANIDTSEQSRSVKRFGEGKATMDRLVLTGIARELGRQHRR